MERRQLEYFIAVMEHGGFTAAAHALHVAQPSLSHAIRTLEREPGGSLFHRLPHGAALTSAGAALVGPARQVLRDLSTASSSVREVLGLSAAGSASSRRPPWRSTRSPVCSGASTWRIRKSVCEWSTPNVVQRWSTWSGPASASSVWWTGQ